MKIEKLDSLLERLCTCSGISGEEQDILCEIEAMLGSSCDTRRDALGNLIVAGKGCLEQETELLLEAHADRIGLIVTDLLQGGFLRAAPCGGMDPRVLPGSPVRIGSITGVVCNTPPHLQGKEGSSEVPEKSILIDVGLSDEDLQASVQLGDRVLLPSAYTKLMGGRSACGAVDNRSGCAALLLCAEQMGALPQGVKLAFCVREETGCQGAAAVAFALQPKKCIAVDVSFALQPFVPEENAALLGGGPMIGVGVPMDKEITGRLCRLAEKKQIPFQREVYGGASGTDADLIGVSGEGVRCALLSIPIRNMHTQVELVELSDIENTARLLAAYAEEYRGGSVG